MATSPVQPGAQVLYNDGFLPSNLGSEALASATSNQLNSIANSNIALQTVNTLFGLGNSSTTPSTSDSVSLSSVAEAAALQASGVTGATAQSVSPQTAAANANASDSASLLASLVPGYSNPDGTSANPIINVLG